LKKTNYLILDKVKRQAMTDKNSDQLKTFYLELAKLAPSQDWQNILKSAKKSKQPKLGIDSARLMKTFFSSSSWHICQ
jgi:hypothetical protein